MNMNQINEKDLENITGGSQENACATVSAKYAENQKVRFINPNDPNEELVGIIRSIRPNLDSNGVPSYIIVVSQGAEAEYSVGRPYNVSEPNVIGVAA